MLINKLRALKKGLFFEKNEHHFYQYLSQAPVSKASGMSQLNTPTVLIEFSNVYSNIIALYYFLKELRKKTNAQFISYALYPYKIWTGLLLYKFKKIYRLLGVDQFIYCYPDTSLEKQIDDYLAQHPMNIKSKTELEKLKLEDVWVGDIIYDSYLYKYKQPTVDLQSAELQKEIREALYYFFFWKNYFKQNKVNTLIVSHTVYTHFTIASRVALQMNIEVFQVNDCGLYRLSTQRPCAYNEFFDYKNEFQKLPNEIQKKGVEWARKRIEMRFEGLVGVDMQYSTKSAWTKKDRCELILESPRKKIFVALHCFFDSPHPYGLNVFPDFYEWLHFLGKISEKTDYDWYLKTHPDFLPGNNEIINMFIKTYPKFKLLPPTTSHHSIIASGIDYVLTVYGTVGMEYAYHGIRVINASPNNIHIAFDFNYHANTVKQYEEVLLNLNQLNFEISQEEILEYYFTKNKVFNPSWFWKSLEDMIKGIGGIAWQSSTRILDYFLRVQNKELELKASTKAREFLNSKDYCLKSKIEEIEFDV